jgi:hypothetical protein
VAACRRLDPRRVDELLRLGGGRGQFDLDASFQRRLDLDQPRREMDVETDRTCDFEALLHVLLLRH